MRVLIACEYSGRVREAFRAKGHDVISCDLLPSEDNSPNHIVGDVFDTLIRHGPFDLMVAHPPCTYLANSGARWLVSRSSINHDRWQLMLDGAKFFAKLYTANIPKIVLENPVMHRHARQAIEQYVEQYSHTSGFTLRSYTKFAQPWWFGDPAFKATGFTCKNVPHLTKPKTALVPPKKGTPEHKAWSVIHQAPPGPDRWKDRSRTFPGIARALAELYG